MLIQWINYYLVINSIYKYCCMVIELAFPSRLCSWELCERSSSSVFPLKSKQRAPMISDVSWDKLSCFCSPAGAVTDAFSALPTVISTFLGSATFWKVNICNQWWEETILITFLPDSRIVAVVTLWVWGGGGGWIIYKFAKCINTNKHLRPIEQAY